MPEQVRRVALFASRFHPHFGGVEEVVRQLAHQQQLRGESPLVVTNRWPKTLPPVEAFEGLPLRRYIFRVPERTWKQMGGAILYAPGVIRDLCADLRTHGTEVINVHCVSSNAWYALRVQRKLKLPLVVTLHSELTMDATGLFQRSAFARGLMRACLKQADAITGVSQKTLTDAEAFYGQPFGDRARVIYNGVDLAEYANIAPYPHPRPYLLGIGRLAPQKGFDVLLRAFAQANLPNLDLLLAGDGEERESLEALTQELQLKGRVHFLGRVERAKTLSLFRGCTFLTLPSRADEGLPMVIMEALAAGKPVLASKVGGVPEAVQDGKTGMLVPKEDVPALAEAMRCLAINPDLREQLSQGARAWAEQSQWSQIAQQYAEVYQRIA